MTKQSDKFALVTGAAKGIGAAIAKTLAADGYGVIIHYRKSKGAAIKVKAEIETGGGRAYLVRGDITKDSQVKKMFGQIAKITPRLDVVVNNAGFDYGKMIEDYTMAEMRYVVDVILVGRMATTKYALPLLKRAKQAQVINIASRMGREKTIETIGAYGPAEAGIIKFTQCCALEFAKYKIRSNCVALSLTDTDLARSAYPTDPKWWQEMASKNPSGRIGQPQDAANMVAFLVSEKASYINGETIGVNGGGCLG